MKHATVKLHYLNDEVADYLLIENEDDLESYEEMLMNAAQKQAEKCIKSPLFPDHVDHMLGGADVGTQLLNIAYIESLKNSLIHPNVVSYQNNPLYQLLPSAQKKIDLMSKILSEGRTVLVGSAGGLMWHSPGRTTILKVYDAPAETGAPKDVIREGAKGIVLENDWALPRESYSYLEKRFWVA